MSAYQRICQHALADRRIGFSGLIAGVAAALLLAGCGPRRPALPPLPPARALAPEWPSRVHATTRGVIELAPPAMPPRTGIFTAAVWIGPVDTPDAPLLIVLPDVGQPAGPLVDRLADFARYGYLVAVLADRPPQAPPRPDGGLAGRQPPPGALPPAAGDRPAAESAKGAAGPPRSAPNHGDVAAQARAFLAPTELAQRIDAIAAAALQVRRAVDPGATAAADAGRLVVWGLGLNAQTAQAIAGERMTRGGASDRNTALNGLAAVILTPPYAGFDGPTESARYADYRAPLLAIVGNDEPDAHGLGLPQRMQQRVFIRAGLPGSVQVALANASAHQLLVADPRNGLMSALMPDGEPAGLRGPPGGPGGGPGGPGRPGGPSGPGGPGGPGGRAPGGPPPGADLPPDPAALSALLSERVRLAGEMHLLVLAYLDARVQNNADAQDWLRDNAPAVLRKVAVLQAK